MEAPATSKPKLRTILYQSKKLVTPEFCPLSPPSPSQILLSASSDDDSDSARQLKKQRRETLAKEYLQYGTVPIMTANLKGPFDKNWRNPWAKQKHSNKQAASNLEVDLDAFSPVDSIPSERESRRQNFQTSQNSLARGLSMADRCSQFEPAGQENSALFKTNAFRDMNIEGKKSAAIDNLKNVVQAAKPPSSSFKDTQTQNGRAPQRPVLSRLTTSQPEPAESRRRNQQLMNDDIDLEETLRIGLEEHIIRVNKRLSDLQASLGGTDITNDDTAYNIIAEMSELCKKKQSLVASLLKRAPSPPELASNNQVLQSRTRAETPCPVARGGQAIAERQKNFRRVHTHPQSSIDMPPGPAKEKQLTAVSCITSQDISPRNKSQAAASGSLSSQVSPVSGKVKSALTPQEQQLSALSCLASREINQMTNNSQVVQSNNSSGWVHAGSLRSRSGGLPQELSDNVRAKKRIRSRMREKIDSGSGASSADDFLVSKRNKATSNTLGTHRKRQKQKSCNARGAYELQSSRSPSGSPPSHSAANRLPASTLGSHVASTHEGSSNQKIKAKEGPNGDNSGLTRQNGQECRAVEDPKRATVAKRRAEVKIDGEDESRKRRKVCSEPTSSSSDSQTSEHLWHSKAKQLCVGPTNACFNDEDSLEVGGTETKVERSEHEAQKPAECLPPFFSGGQLQTEATPLLGSSRSKQGTPLWQAPEGFESSSDCEASNASSTSFDSSGPAWAGTAFIPDGFEYESPKTKNAPLGGRRLPPSPHPSSSSSSSDTCSELCHPRINTPSFKNMTPQFSTSSGSESPSSEPCRPSSKRPSFRTTSRSTGTELQEGQKQWHDDLVAAVQYADDDELVATVENADDEEIGSLVRAWDAERGLSDTQRMIIWGSFVAPNVKDEDAE